MTDQDAPTPFTSIPKHPQEPSAAPLTAPDRNAAMEAAAALEEVLHEIKQVVIGQDAMLERVLAIATLPGRSSTRRSIITLPVSSRPAPPSDHRR